MLQTFSHLLAWAQYYSQFMFFIQAIGNAMAYTYIVLHAASFSSWIDITNHKGKHWIKLCILGYSANRLSSDVWFIEWRFVCTYHQIQLLADLNLKKTPQLVELFDDSKVNKGRHVLIVYFYFGMFSWNKFHFNPYCAGYRWGFELVTRKNATSVDEPSSEKSWLQENR